MITIQLLLLGAICLVAWYILKIKEEKYQVLKDQLSFEEKYTKELEKDLEISRERTTYWIKKYFEDYGKSKSNKVRKTTKPTTKKCKKA